MEKQNMPETEKALCKFAVSHATTPENEFILFMNIMEADRNYWMERCRLAENHINNYFKYGKDNIHR